ncbi:MAG: O-acetylhomoserine aminocarboxypropyltransferase/cysteine synthase, partial [Clostridia bacterium]|nr:O-acetylhomoserine aminocarboxypropyltransferase/cysteine synthase [Clostridia bacterium]
MHINTRCLHAGYEAKNGEPTNPPIVQSTTYKYESSEFMGALFDLKEDGFFYSRLANPTVDMVEKKLADLEGGVGAILTSSGQSANMYAIINICKAGDHVISSSAIYGGTFNLFNKTLRDLGIDFTFISPYASDEEIEAAFKENTKCVFGETLSNPSLDILDIERFAKIAHRHKVPLILDNTFPTPVNCRPFEFGADIVTHSTTKYLDGHAAVVGGAVVDSGRFDWDASGLFPMLTEPDESYHGIIYVKQFGKAAYMAKMKAHIMRDIGSMMSP